MGSYNSVYSSTRLYENLFPNTYSVVFFPKRLVYREFKRIALLHSIVSLFLKVDEKSWRTKPNLLQTCF